MRLRTFKVLEEQALRLSNRAAAVGESPADLVRQFVDEFFTNPQIPTATYSLEDKIVLRSFYLTEYQDDRLAWLAKQHKVTIGMLFRQVISKGLGT
jgi:hypothetical protein